MMIFVFLMRTHFTSCCH